MAQRKNGKRLLAADVRPKVKLAVFLLVVIGLFSWIGWGSLSSMGVGSIAYLCPLGSLETLLAAKTSVPRFVITLVVMLALAALLGRAFCAWVCPVPSVSAFFHPRKQAEAEKHALDAKQGEGAYGDRKDAGDEDANPSAPQVVACSSCVGAEACADGSPSAPQVMADSCSEARGLAPVGGRRDGLRLDSRHAVLVGALASSAIFGFPVFCLVCPIGLSIATVVAVWQLIFAQSPSWSLVVFPLIILVEVVFFRKWCHRICPMGALMSLLGQKSLPRPVVKEGACMRAKGVDCRTCVTSCPEQLDPHSESVGECTKCGICEQKCPAHAIEMRLASKFK